MVTHFTELTDSQWEVMKEVFNHQRKRKHNLREVVNALLFILRTGIQWRNLPRNYPKWTIIYYYFRHWQKDGTIEVLNLYLFELERQAWGKDSTPSQISIDSQSVKSVPMVKQARGLDPFKKVNGRKRHIVVDTLGLVFDANIAAANSADAVEGAEIMKRNHGLWNRLIKVLVDGAYQGQFLQWVRENTEAVVEVASRPPTQQGFVPIRWRWVVERTFAWFNFYRRLSKDYEKTTESSKAWLLLANCSVIINRFQ